MAMICPLHIPNVRDRILEHVGPPHVWRLRRVSHDWNESAVGALATASSFSRVRVTSENVDEYVSSSLLRGVAVASATSAPYRRLKLAVDFGRAPTRAQFQHLIDALTIPLLPGPAVDQSGGGPLPSPAECVDKITFHGADDSFAVAPADWEDLLRLLRLAAPQLRALDLFERNWRVADGSFPDWQHFRTLGRLSFPALEELAFCLQKPTERLLDALLQPGVAPALTKVQLTAEFEFLVFKLQRYVMRLQHYSRLKELTLDLNMPTCHYTSAELRTVRRLCLHIYPFECEDFSTVALFGDFIGRIFPEVRSLDLRYQPGDFGTDAPWFPWEIGPLPRLEALGYGWIDPGWRTEPLLVSGSELQPHNNFPALRSVTTDLGLELSNLDREGQRLAFLTVCRLKIRLSAAATLTGDELQRCATNLHELYPHVTRLALDLANTGANSKAGVEILLREFRGFEELEILGCSIQGGELLRELLDDRNGGTGGALRLVRRLKVKLERGLDKTEASTSVANVLGAFPRLECAEVDEMLVAGSSSMANALELQGKNPRLKIEFI